MRSDANFVSAIYASPEWSANRKNSVLQNEWIYNMKRSFFVSWICQKQQQQQQQKGKMF